MRFMCFKTTFMAIVDHLFNKANRMERKAFFSCSIFFIDNPKYDYLIYAYETNCVSSSSLAISAVANTNFYKKCVNFAK